MLPFPPPAPASAAPALTAREALRLGTQRLRTAEVESAQLDMSLIMAEALGTDRLGLYMDLDRPLNAPEREKARALLARRIAHEPMAYLLGRREFFGLSFAVSRETLIPRPETEHLVETALEWLQREAGTARLVDVGTGTGAIAIALTHARLELSAVAIDISAGALEVARANAQTHGVAERVELRMGSLLEPLQGDAAPFDLILSNPPYIPERDRESLAPDVVRFEPHTALFSGADGLDCIRALVRAAPGRLRVGGLLALECGAGQATAVAELIGATGAFEPAWIVNDLAGIPRVVAALRRAS